MAAATAMVPLYLAGHVVALGLTSVVLGTPAMGGCAYVCWRILRADQVRVAAPGGRG
jgi:hypothetical protein